MEKKDEHVIGIFSLDGKRAQSIRPATQSYVEGCDQITKLLSKRKLNHYETAFVISCGIIAGFASYYNFAFGKEYVHDVSVRWGFSEEEAKIFGYFCGTVGLIINTAINGKSLHQAHYVIKDELLKKKERMPDESMVRMSIGILALFSMIGALPNLKFVFDTSKDDPLAYRIFEELVQFLTISALNFRGIYNIFSKQLPTQKKLDVQLFKLELLTAINGCLIANRLEDDQLVALGQGKLVKEKAQRLRKILKGITFAYVGPYSISFFFAVVRAMPTANTGYFIDEMLDYGTISLGLISSGLKWFLLGNAYFGLVDRIFNLFQEPLLKINQNEVRSQYISRRLDKALAVAGLIGAIFSLGSSSKIAENYIFPDMKTALTFVLSLIIGGGAALGINAMDLSTIIERIIDFCVTIYKTKIKPSNDPCEYLGNSHDEMIMRIMLQIANMPDHVFLQKFTTEIHRSQSQENPAERKLSKVESVHGHYPNDEYEDILLGCQKLKTSVNNFSFFSYKRNRANVEQQLEEYIESVPLVNK